MDCRAVGDFANSTTFFLFCPKRHFSSTNENSRQNCSEHCRCLYVISVLGSLHSCVASVAITPQKASYLHEYRSDFDKSRATLKSGASQLFNGGGLVCVRAVFVAIWWKRSRAFGPGVWCCLNVVGLGGCARNLAFVSRVSCNYATKRRFTH